MNRVGAGDDDPCFVQHGYDGPVVDADEVREYQFRLVLEPEAEAKDPEHRAVGIGDAKCIDQRLLPARNKVALAKALDIGGLRFDGGANERVGARGRRDLVVQAGEHVALRIEQDDVGINRIFTNVFAESAAQRRQCFVLTGRIARVAQEGADILVAR